jgi:hypothetical protein
MGDITAKMNGRPQPQRIEESNGNLGVYHDAWLHTALASRYRT